MGRVFVWCRCLQAARNDRARHYKRSAQGKIVPMCEWCSDRSQREQALRFDEDTANLYVCQEIHDS